MSHLHSRADWTCSSFLGRPELRLYTLHPLENDWHWLLWTSWFRVPQGASLSRDESRQPPRALHFTAKIEELVKYAGQARALPPCDCDRAWLTVPKPVFPFSCSTAGPPLPPFWWQVWFCDTALGPVLPPHQYPQVWFSMLSSVPQPGEFLVEDRNHNMEDSWVSELPPCKGCIRKKKEGLVEKVQLGFG